MSSTIKVTLSLSDEAVAALAEMTSERKRGELISKLVLDTHKRGGMPADGILERIEQRLQRIEEKLEQ